ncbi:MAG: hypothetical protein HZA36_02275 [Parcubacteria group bacterium]|nr:hypothetical protein [Parcubacteria group bacterium]
MDNYSFVVLISSRPVGTYSTFYDAFRVFWKHMHRYARAGREIINTEHRIAFKEKEEKRLGLTYYFYGAKEFARSVDLLTMGGRLKRKKKEEQEEIERIFLAMYMYGWTISIIEEWHPNNLKDPIAMLHQTHQTKRAP